MSINTILGPPHLGAANVLNQFRSVFVNGFYLCQTTAIFLGLCCFANAALGAIHCYRHYSAVDFRLSGPVPRLLLAGGLMVGIVPYSILFVVPVEEELTEIESRLTRGEDVYLDNKDIREMMSTWKLLNYGRMVLPVIGAAIAWTLW